MSTLENYKKCIDTKFTNLFEIKKKLVNYNILPEGQSLLEAVYKTYMFKTVDIMCKYSNIGKGDEKDFMSMFNRVVVRENIVNKLDRILNKYRKLVSSNTLKI